MQEPRIEERGPVRFVGMEVNFIHCMSPDANHGERLGGLWRTLFDRIDEITGRSGDCFGMTCGVPAVEMTHPDERRYCCGAAVDGEPPIPDGMAVFETPAATYAVFEHRGPIDDIARTVGEIYDEWLPQSGYEHSCLADVELYDERFDGCTPESVMEYWISVRPRSSD